MKDQDRQGQVHLQPQPWSHDLPGPAGETVLQLLPFGSLRQLARCSKSWKLPAEEAVSIYFDLKQLRCVHTKAAFDEVDALLGLGVSITEEELGSSTSPATLIPYPGKPSSTCRSQKVSGNSPSVIGSHSLLAEVISSIAAFLSCWKFSLSWALARWRNRPSPMESAPLDEWCMTSRWFQPLAS